MPTVRLHDFEAHWPIFLMMEATGWRFLPTQLLEQPESLMEDLLALRAASISLQHQKDTPPVNGGDANSP